MRLCVTGNLTGRQLNRDPNQNGLPRNVATPLSVQRAADLYQDRDAGGQLNRCLVGATATIANAHIVTAL